MAKSSTFAHRLRELLDIKGITQAQLASRSGIGRSNINHYLKGDWEGKQDAVYAIAHATGVSEAWLMGYDVPMDAAVMSLQNILPLPGTKKKPRLGAIACGQPILAAGEVEEYDDVPEDVECDFTLVCKGDSMINARIFDGDIVYIRSQPKVDNGQIAAVRIGDEATLKKVYYTPGSDRIVLRACNPLYPDMVYEGPQLELEQVEIIGLAVGFYSEIRHDQ